MGASLPPGKMMWQSVVGLVLLLFIVLIIITILCLVNSYFNFMPMLTPLFLLIGYFIILLNITLLLNLTRGLYVKLLFLFSFYIIVSITSFALHYKTAGLIYNGFRILPTFRDAVYFSVVTFTTVGYGDFQPVPDMRLMVSIEALIGVFSMAIFTAFVWFGFNESIVPSHQALFDKRRDSDGQR